MLNETTTTKAKKSATGYVADWIIEHWPSLAAASSTVAMTYLASITALLSAYGPFGWAVAGILSSLSLSAAFWVFSRARLAVESRRTLALLSHPPQTVNPLRSHFDTERISVSDFFYPAAGLQTGKTFKNCDIVGPGVIVLVDSCNLFNSTFAACDIIALRPNEAVQTGVGFRQTTFDGCKFVSVAIFVAHAFAGKIAAGIKSAPGSEIKVIGL